METLALIYLSAVMTIGLAFIVYGGVYIWKKLDTVIDEINSELRNKQEDSK